MGILFWIQKDPLFLYPQIDGKEYYQWALRISEGQWFQSKPFYQAPLYPYLLALLSFILPLTPTTIALVQILLSVATAGLLFCLTQNIFEKRVAWVAFLLYTFTGTIYFYEVQPLKTSLALFLTTLVVFFFLKNPFPALKAGLSVGSLILVRGNTYILIPFLLLSVFFYKKLSLKKLFIFLIGLFFPLSFSITHNYLACQEWILSTYQGGSNFFIGNNELATGTYQPLLSGRQTPTFEGSDARFLAQKMAERPLSYREISRFWFQQSFLFFQKSPQKAFQLQIRKLGLYFWPSEMPDGLQYDFWRLRYPIYIFLPVGYAFLWIFALIGLFYLPREKRLFFICFLFGSLISVVPFFIFTRYRLPVIIGLYPLASLALCSLSPKKTITLLLLGIALEWLPTPLSNSYFILGSIEFQLGQYPEAEKSLRQACELGKHPEAWAKLGEYYLQQKQWKQAEGCLLQALSLSPKWDIPYFLLGLLFLEQSMLQRIPFESEEKALEFFEKSVYFSIQKEQIYAKIALAYWDYAQNKMNPKALWIAISFMEKATMLNPNWEPALKKMKKTAE